jgi:hypothetical protein
LRTRLAAAAGILLLAVAAPPAGARVLLTADEALALAFPGCAIERRTVYLTAAQRERAQDLAGVEIPGEIVRPYVARRDTTVAGTAYFDTHRVRTLSETLMVVVGPTGAAARVEVIAFDEPDSYRARPTWYAQFEGRPLDDELALQHAIRGLTGATLTARATTRAVRRVLALHRVLAEGGAP